MQPMHHVSIIAVIPPKGALDSQVIDARSLSVSRVRRDGEHFLIARALRVVHRILDFFDIIPIEAGAPTSSIVPFMAPPWP